MYSCEELGEAISDNFEMAWDEEDAKELKGLPDELHDLFRAQAAKWYVAGAKAGFDAGYARAASVSRLAFEEGIRQAAEEAAQ